MTDKKKNNRLIKVADEVIFSSRLLFKSGTDAVDPAFNGQIAALGVMIAMIGLKPAICMYCQDNENTKVSRKKIISVLAGMISGDTAYNACYAGADELRTAVVNSTGNDEKALKEEILDCLSALKQVARTYINE